MPPALAQANAHGSCTKPILKHRSITEILCLPPSPHFDVNEPSAGDLSASHEQQPPSAVSPPLSRPLLTHTKSDTHIIRSRILRKDSPPRILSKESAESGLSVDESASPGTSTSSEQDLAPNAPRSGKRRHISFNTFVEQCIAIEKPKPKRPSTRFVDEVFEEDDGSVSSPFPTLLISDSTTPLFPTVMTRIRKGSLITPAFPAHPKPTIPRPTNWIPTLTPMTYWRCRLRLPDQDHHHHPVLVPLHSPCIPPLQTEVLPLTMTTTGQSPTLLPRF